MRIYDGNNQARRIWETDTTGRPMKTIQDESNIPGELRIWVWDGFGANARRRTIFDGYKSNRKKAPDDFYKTINQVKKMLRHTSAMQVEVEGYEADDVIATLVAGWNRNEPVHIISTDRDLQPLRLLRGVTTSQTNIPGVMPQDVQLYKTTVGDSSDSIPGIKGFGKKSWESVNLNQLREIVCQGRDASTVPGLSAKVVNWLAVTDNRIQLKKMWDCVGLLDVPLAEITRNLRAGVRDDAAAIKVMQEFLQ